MTPVQSPVAVKPLPPPPPRIMLHAGPRRLDPRPQRGTPLANPTAATGVHTDERDPDAPAVPSGEGGMPAGEPNGQGTGGEGGMGGTPPEPIDLTATSRLPYTRQALEARVSGVVLVSLLVDQDGAVASARVVQGVGYGLDEIAADLAKKIRFRPARDASGKPVAARVRWKFRFEPTVH